MPAVLKIRVASHADHAAITKIAKQSKYTKDFTNMIFSGKDCYEAGRIRVALQGGKVVGFTCFRHRQRDSVTVLYFVGVEMMLRSQGIGERLLTDLWDVSTGEVEFKVMKDNRAVALYQRLGFKTVGTAYKDEAWVMRAKRDPPSVQAGLLRKNGEARSCW